MCMWVPDLVLTRPPGRKPVAAAQSLTMELNK